MSPFLDAIERPPASQGVGGFAFGAVQWWMAHAAEAQLVAHAVVAAATLVDRMSRTGRHLSGHATAFLVVADEVFGYEPTLAWVADVLDDEVAWRDGDDTRMRRGATLVVPGGMVVAISLTRAKDIATRHHPAIAATLALPTPQDAFYVLAVVTAGLTVRSVPFECSCGGPSCRPTLPPPASTTRH